MEDLKNKKVEIISHEVPEIPALMNEMPELAGVRRWIHQFRLDRIESETLAKKKKILAEATMQLMKDRTQELVTTWRIQATAVREVMLRAAEDYVDYILIVGKRKMDHNKAMAVKEATEEYWDLVSSIRPDLPDSLKNKVQEKAEMLLDETIASIIGISFDVEKAIERNYPGKKRLFERLIS
jgi:hypothetical protein